MRYVLAVRDYKIYTYDIHVGKIQTCTNITIIRTYSYVLCRYFTFLHLTRKKLTKNAYHKIWHNKLIHFIKRKNFNCFRNNRRGISITNDSSLQNYKMRISVLRGYSITFQYYTSMKLFPFPRSILGYKN